MIEHPETRLYLHHNFVSAVLNDLFGIQARGGCACAGPYAQDLLGIDPVLAAAYESILLEDSRLDRTHLRRHGEHSDHELFRPGFVRLNFPFFMPGDEVDFVLSAIHFIAKSGWKLLAQYNCNNETGEWRHKKHTVYKERRWLGRVTYVKVCVHAMTSSAERQSEWRRQAGRALPLLTRQPACVLVSRCWMTSSSGTLTGRWDTQGSRQAGRNPPLSNR